MTRNDARNIRRQEALDALRMARDVLMIHASSLVRANDDEGLYYSNELHQVCQELNQHMRDIRTDDS